MSTTKNMDTALITGASNGIGLELAKVHAKKGGNLVLVARSEDKLQTLKQEIEDLYKVQVTVFVDDLSEPESANRVFQTTESLGIKISTLINNAGFGGHGLFHEQDIAAHQAMIQVNMVTLTNLTWLYLPEMVRNNYGRILNVSSTASFIPGPFQAVYYATKAYVTSLTQAIANEVEAFNITATALCPGAVATGFVEAGNLDGLDVWNNAKSAESVAVFGYKAMEKGQLVAINEGGLRFMLDWLIPFMPRKLVLKLSRQAMEKKTR